MLTLSAIVASQPGTASSWRTMSTWPCSQAHMSAVEPSSSRMFTCAPQDSSALTMSPRPWLTASIRAVCPAYGEEHRSSDQEPPGDASQQHCMGHGRRSGSGQQGAHLAGLGVDVASAQQLQDGLKVAVGVECGQGSQHDGRVASLVLLVGVTQTCAAGIETDTAVEPGGWELLTVVRT